MKGRVREVMYWAFALLAGSAVLLIAHVNRLTFPFPVTDEARFYLPAFWWAQHGTLSPGDINAPHGIFWVPDGFTVLIGMALRTFGPSMQIARMVCEAMVAGSVSIFAFGFRALAKSSKMGAIATLLLVSPPIVLAANMVRMEAILILVLACALLLHVRGHFLGAGSLLLGGFLFHPALGIALAGYVILFLIFRKSLRTHCFDRRHALDWFILATVVICIFLEVIHLWRHLDLFRAHMAFQTSRKLAVPFARKFRNLKGVLLLLSCVSVTALIWRRRLASSRRSFAKLTLVGAISLGIQLYAVWGGEMAYDAYSLSLGPAILFCLVFGEVR